MISKVEIRVTRLDLYQNKKDLSGHQGHYFTAKTFQDAVTNAEQRYPNENLSTTLWKQWDDKGKQF
jgi:hypothetical protein